MKPSRSGVVKRQRNRKHAKAQSISRSRVCHVPRPGQKCPNCGRGILDYDGLLQLSCPVCRHVAAGGGFT